MKKQTIILTANTCAAFLALSLFFISLMPAAATAQAGSCDVIHTSKGKISGVYLEKKNVCAYLGVPYAAPPVGKLRFALPQEHEPWAETLAADKLGAQCPQSAGPMTDTSLPMNEDCLYLNIWKPADAKENTAVMVFIHGGGFIVGSGGTASYDGSTLAQRGGVIVVTINYRLGVLGFLAHPAFADAKGRTGNWGLYDQLESLKWVNKNIAAFGGAPDNVTLFGQSAGGMSVGIQLASPLAAGLFRNAMIHSGPPTLLNTTMQQSSEAALKIAPYVGCSDPSAAADCLRAVPPDDFLNKVPLGIFIMDDLATEIKSFMTPVIDGEMIPDSLHKLFRDGKFNRDVRVVIGTTKDEASYFTMKKTLKEKGDFRKNLEMDLDGVKKSLNITMEGDLAALEAMYPIEKYKNVEKAYQDLLCDVGFTCPLEQLAEMIVKYQPEVYRFYHVKGPEKLFNLGAFHGAELPYIFGNFVMMGQKFDSKDNLALAKKVIPLWSGFAKTGTFKVEGVPEWPEYDIAEKKYIIIDDELTIGSALKSDKCPAIGKILEANFGE